MALAFRLYPLVTIQLISMTSLRPQFILQELPNPLSIRLR